MAGFEVNAWTIAGSDGEAILGNTHLPDGEPTGVMLLCHGFKGYKDYGFFPSLAAAAARGGLIAHRFNFSHSGMTNQIERFARADLFEADTWSRQVADLAAVAAAVEAGELAGQGLPVVWFGHSRGGLTALITAGRAFTDSDGRMAQPAALIAASSPDEPCSLSAADRAALHKTGRMPVPSSRTGQMLYLGLAWLEEIETDPQAFDPKAAAGRIPCPMLFLHGDADATVPVAASQRLAEAAGTHGRLHVIEHAAHTFNAPNPLPMDQTPPAETNGMMNLAVAFAREACQAG